MKQKVLNFLKQEPVLVFSALLALISCIFVPPSMNYLSYLDEKTLILLFCLMLVTAGLEELGLFHWIGRKMTRCFKTQRGIAFVLIALCFFSSMFITNDVSLITFIPLGLFTLKVSGFKNRICTTITLMTIAANLGSMLTPIGNPQNLFLYSFFKLSLSEFFGAIFPYTLIAAILLVFIIMFAYNSVPITVPSQTSQKAFNKIKLISYLCLFAVCILSVLNFLPVLWLLGIVLVAFLIINPHLFFKVDYNLLLTFVFFFIFIGNIQQIPVFQTLIGQMIQGQERNISIIASQVISNVPSALLLSGFTDQWKQLLIGTNIGGLGTIIASMASLISYKQLAMESPDIKGRYFMVFSAFNFGILAFYIVFGILFPGL